jgi:hypothetical protein
MKKTASNDALDRALTTLYQADIPAGYAASWRDAVKREETSEMKPFPRWNWLKRAVLPAAAALVLVVGTLVTGELSSKTSSAPPPAGYDEAASIGETYKAEDTAAYGLEKSADIQFAPMPNAQNTMDTSARGSSGDTASAAAETATDSRKIVRTVSLTLSSKAFEQDYDAVLALADSTGGYASAVNLYDQQSDQRSASFELRIPSDRLDSFLSGLEGIGRITERYETTTDMTTQYSDTSLRLQTQQAKMARLQELLLKAENVTDLLAIESQIADTQYEIDWLQSTLLTIDRQVDYATVSVYLTEQTPIETAAAEDLSVGERIINGLKASLAWLGGFFENMLVFLIAAAPVLIPLVVLYIVYRVIRKRSKSNKQS